MGLEEEFRMFEFGVFLRQTDLMAVFQQTLLHGLFQPIGQALDVTQDVQVVSHRQLDGSSRRRRAKISHQIGDRRIGFVSDAGDDRSPKRKHCERDLLVVEGPKIFDGASPSGQDDHITTQLVGFLQSSDDLRGCVRTLDKAFQNGQSCHRPPEMEGFEDVLKRSGLLARDDGEVLGIHRQRLFPTVIEATLLIQFALESFVTDIEVADTGILHAENAALQGTLDWIDRDGSPNQHRVPFLGHEIDLFGVALKHDAGDLGTLVFKREVPMPAAMRGEVGDFPFQIKSPERIIEFQGRLNGLDEGADGIDRISHDGRVRR